MSFPFPVGFDRADGSVFGTANPTGALRKSSATFFEELPDSPEIERADQGTFVHNFKCDPTTAFNIILTTYRGLIVTDSFGLNYKVLSCKEKYQRADYVIITITVESLSFDLPVEQFEFSETDFNPAIEKHPRYAPLKKSTIQAVKQSVSIRMFGGVASAVDNDAIIANISNPTERDAAKELRSKMLKGIDSFYLPLFKITYSVFSYNSQAINPGGYIEDPITSGILPYYFWSVDGTPFGNSIFSAAAAKSPMFYGNGITWLRLCDHENYERTWFRRTLSWIGAPAGGNISILGALYYWNSHWDRELYSPTFLPYNTEQTPAQ